jgi:hypothetical protein
MGISMDREDDGDIRTGGDVRHRAANPFETPVKALAAMPGHQDQPPVAEMVGKHRPKAATDIPVVVQQSGHPQQRIDASIAGNEDALRRDPLLEQVVAGSRGRRSNRSSTCASISRCCPVTQILQSTSGRLDSSLTTGASLMASGRVPNTHRTFISVASACDNVGWDAVQTARQAYL